MSKKAKHEEHMDESWLIPYADILTLLLALFIVLFSSSSLDLEKYEQIMKAFANEFNATASGEGSGPGEAGGAGDFLPDDMAKLLEQNAANDAASDGGEGGAENPQMDQLYNSFFEYISGNQLGDEMQIKIVGESLLLTLTSDIWFPSGSATISASQRETAKKIADMISTSNSQAEPLSIVITGHTDNVPIGTAQFRSNWYLSATRAINFMEVMLDQSDLDPRIFSARGYGEYEPVDTNATAQGRQRNRRVEVLISIDNFTKQETGGGSQ